MDLLTRWREVSPAPDPTSVAGRRLHDETEPIFDQGLAFDLETLVDRRRVLQLMGTAGVAAGLFTVAACVPGATTSTPSTTSAGATAGGTVDAASCEVIPEETAGPFPGDGTNGPDMLNQAGVVRSDIRSSFGSMSGTAEGVPLTIDLTIVDAAADCAPLAGAAVYLWHCDRDGLYSLYSQGVTDQNYLRGVQEADADGRVTFTSIFPGCYSGRWPHVHFEVYRSLAEATDAANTVATSQIALPEADSDAVYATSGYEESVTNLAGLSLESDNVFGEDGGVRQLGTVTGSVESGLAVALTVPVNAT
jgi:protocatechuate 3,4-dioxygenase beta subunit